MIIEFATIGKVIVGILSVVVIGYIFVAGFKGNTEMHNKGKGGSGKGSSSNSSNSSSESN